MVRIDIVHARRCVNERDVRDALLDLHEDSAYNGAGNDQEHTREYDPQGGQTVVARCKHTTQLPPSHGTTGASW